MLRAVGSRDRGGIYINNKAFTDGWRGRIGLVATAPGNSTEAEFNSYRPKGVAVLTTRTPLTSSTVGGISEMEKHIEHSAVMLAENAFCDVVLLSSTAGSFVNGAEYDRQLTQRLSAGTGAKVISSCRCMLTALKAIGAGCVTLITPSASDLNEAERRFLSDCGIKITGEGSFLLSSPRDILRISPEEVYVLAKQADSTESDAVLISCSGLHVMDMIETMENDFGKPVIASNQFGLWGALRALGIKDRIQGAGSLFSY